MRILVFSWLSSSEKGLFNFDESPELISVRRLFTLTIDANLLASKTFDKIIILEKCNLFEKKLRDLIEFILVLKYFIEFLLFAMFL